MATVNGKLTNLVRLVRRSLGLSEQTVEGGLPRGYDVVRIAAALLLLVAAGLKAHQLATEPVLGTGLLESRWFLIGLVEFELFFGLWLLSGLLPRLTRLAALACFSAFACYSLYKALSGSRSCGCFGPVQVNPWHTSTLDLAIVASLVRWRPKGGGPLSIVTIQQRTVRAVSVLVIWLSVGLPAAFWIGSYHETTLSDAGEVIGRGTTVVLQPETWIGKRFPLLPYLEGYSERLQPSERPLSQRLTEGQWLVVLYYHDCPECQKAIPRFRELVRRSATDSRAPQVALIEIPPYDDQEMMPVLVGPQCTLGRLSDKTEWLVKTPTVSLLDGGIVSQSDKDTDLLAPLGQSG